VSVALIIISSILLKTSLKYYRALKALLATKTPSIKKPRKRYVVFSLICEGDVSRNSLEKAVMEKIAEYYGQSLLHKASPYIVFFDEKTRRGVIRVTHLYVNHVIAAIGFIKNIGGKKCIVIPIRTTGTLKKAREYFAKKL